MKASRNPIGTYPSTTVVITWSATRPRQKSERLRCTDCERNRGQRSVVHPIEAITPTTRLAVRATRATKPADRVKYHSAVELCPTAEGKAVMVAPPVDRYLRRLDCPSASRPPGRCDRPRAPDGPEDRAPRASLRHR